MVGATAITVLQQQWSTHKHTNAYARAAFGDQVRGIFGATPSEPMHCIRKGAVERIIALVIKELSASQKKLLDQMAMKFHAMHRQTCRREYPQTNFGSGVTNLTKISAKENMGVLFLFVILSNYDEGWKLLSGALKKKGRDLADAIEVMEALLCFDAWLRLETQWHFDREEEAIASAETSIRVLMKLCIEHLPRLKGNGWRIPKFHEMLHLPGDMARFGASPNFWADRVESLLKDTAKKVGRRSQKRHQGVLFEIQSAQRYTQTCQIDALHQRLGSPELYNNDPNPVDSDSAEEEEEDDEEEIIRQGTGNATFGTVVSSMGNTGRLNSVLSWCTKSDLQSMRLPVELLHYVGTQFGPRVTICTEYTREDNVFRCHPNHMDCGPIFDWMKVLFVDEKDEEVVYPCRLAAIIVNEAIDPEEDGEAEQFQLVVQCAQAKTGVKSALFTEWTWSPQYTTVAPSNIEGPCFVVTITPNKILETLHHQKWAQQFTELFPE